MSIHDEKKASGFAAPHEFANTSQQVSKNIKVSPSEQSGGAVVEMLRSDLENAKTQISELELRLWQNQHALDRALASQLPLKQKLKRRILSVRGGWRVQAAWWRIQAVLRSIEQKRMAKSRGDGNQQAGAFGNAEEDHPEYKFHSRAQADYVRTGMKQPSRQSRSEILRLFSMHPNRKGVVLCPVAYDLELKQRPDHIMAAFAKDGYLCVQLEVNNKTPYLRRAGEGCYVSNMTVEFFSMLHDKPVVLYLHWPGFVHYAEIASKALVVYDVLDDLTVFASPSETMRSDHRILLERADITLFSARKLLEKNKANTSHGVLYENGVYMSDFTGGVRELCPLPEGSKIDSAEVTVVGYHGVISELIDFDLIDQLAAMPNVVLLFVGPVAAFVSENLDEVKRRMARLEAQPDRFIHLGPKKYADLKHYLAWIDVGIVPFVVSEKTDAVSPLKLFEYLAAGKPVIGTPTRTMLNYEGPIVVAAGEQFVQAIASGAWKSAYTDASAELAASHEWRQLHTPLREFVAANAVARKPLDVTTRSRPKVDIVNINFYDWHGEVVFKGGAERYVYDLAVLLAEMGCDVRILQNSYEPFERTFKGIKVLGIAATPELDFVKISQAYADFCKDSDVLIASPAELACRLPQNKKVLSINHGIHWDSKCNRVERYDRSRYDLILDAVKNSDGCVCVDTNFINWMRTYDWPLANSLSYVPNYVDLQQFKPNTKDFQNEPLCFLYPRRLYEPRGLYLTIDAFDALFARHDNIRLVFCGQAIGADVDATEAFIARHPGRVAWIEHDMDDMHLAYVESHIVLVPTTESEGTSLSCIEALATNNAVISTNVGGLPNLIVDGYNGLLIRPSMWDLVQAAERLIGDRQLVEKLAANAQLTAEGFSKDAWKRRWNQVINTVVFAD